MNWRWSTAILASLLGLVTVMLAACSRSPVTPPKKAAPQAAPKAMHRIDDIQFEPPGGWSTERIAGGVLILAPTIEAGWQANIFLELRRAPQDRSLEAALADNIAGLREAKSQFREIRRSVEETGAGLQYAIVEYTSKNEDTSLTEWEMIVPLSGQKRLFILASSASALREKYHPAFAAFVGTLEPAK